MCVRNMASFNHPPLFTQLAVVNQWLRTLRNRGAERVPQDRKAGREGDSLSAFCVSIEHVVPGVLVFSVASFDWREAGEAIRDVPTPGIVGAFGDMRHALTGETPCIQRRHVGAAIAPR